jgi:tetratricopeptide (TPR) repeat protein
VGEERLRYEQALQRGHAALWQKQWAAAIAAYREALTVAPEEPEALTGLGLACMEAGRYEEALEAFRQLERLRPEDPAPVWRLAEVHQRAGRAAEAAAHYHRAGRMFADRGDLRRAIQAWAQAVRLDPGRIETLEALARAYRQLDQREAAIRVDLALARAWIQQGDLQRALEAIDAALALDPDHPQALQARDWLRVQLARRTGTGPLPRPTSRAESAEAEQARAEALWMLAPEEAEAPADPIRRALSQALRELADLVFSEEPGSFSESEWFRIHALLGRAVDAHAQGQLREALAFYEQVRAAGLEHPALPFAIGAALAELRRCEEAASYLRRATDVPTYAFAGLLLLARCEERQGAAASAALRYLEALESLDQELAREESQEVLRERYRFLRSWLPRHPDRQAALLEGARQILESPTWEDRILWIRQALDQWTAGTPFRLTLADALLSPQGERVLLDLGQTYTWAQLGLFYSALEEALRILAGAPFAPLTHLILGQLLVWSRHIPAAANKFRILGAYFLHLEDPYMALAAFEQVTRLAPMDLAALERLLQLAQTLGDAPRALQAFYGLVDAHMQMADLEQAERIGREGLAWASRHGLPGSTLSPLLRRLVEIAVQRLDWNGAIEHLERLRALAPEDLEARWGLVEAYLRVNRKDAAERELQQLVERAQAAEQLAEAVRNLEELILLFPDEIALRQRAAQLYLELEQHETAVAHLEQVGEQYLQAGRLTEAQAVYRSLMRLNPAQAERYRALLGSTR